MSHDRSHDAPAAADAQSPTPPADTSRRRFLQSAAAAAALGATPHLHAQQTAPSNEAANESANEPSSAPPVVPAQPVQLTINGREYALHIEPRVTLLDALRDYAGLTGTKKGCDRGQCGACTVLVEGRRINACLTLAVMHEGQRITTVEGLASATQPSAIQRAFVERDALQCGFCTPGQLCSATACLGEFAAGTASAATADVRTRPAQLSDAEIRERMSGNLCRCGAYVNIVAAVRDAHSAGA
ncbi:2Fe-2S iron-sulfur cluster-binding protein [Paraburkholderia sp.]|uniref:(2Fe-2S)-binding protein n=1 Tax=Paraburkholderia sp. TaxID=1926495 RepID=UPI00286F2984|nr:2Fe-2S iron-sulfur cluster-binding protein [Paraburkholderia sp.]